MQSVTLCKLSILGQEQKKQNRRDASGEMVRYAKTRSLKIGYVVFPLFGKRELGPGYMVEKLRKFMSAYCPSSESLLSRPDCVDLDSCLFSRGFQLRHLRATSASSCTSDGPNTASS